MIGTANEMLLYLSYSSRDFKKVRESNKSIIKIRNHVSRDEYSEKQMSKMLQQLGCTMIRPRVVVPAIIVDRHKRVFDEYTFIKTYMSPFVEEELKRKLSMEDIYTKEGCLHPRAMTIFLHKKKAYISAPRCVLPSVWSYEPPYASNISPRIADTIGRIIGNQIPFRGE